MKFPNDHDVVLLIPPHSKGTQKLQGQARQDVLYVSAPALHSQFCFIFCYELDILPCPRYSPIQKLAAADLGLGTSSVLSSSCPSTFYLE